MEIPFDGLLTLLIFLVGIPALILQMISSAERQAVLKRGSLDVKVFLAKAFFAMFVGLILQIFLVLIFDDEQKTFPIVQQVVWLGLFLYLFYLVWQVSQEIPEQYGRREKIIEKIVEQTKNESIFKSTPRIGGKAFSELANLGKQCDPGSEREMVINAFKDLVQEILSHNKYNGDSFEDLIEELIHMLVSNPEPKDLCCYDTAIKTLAAILSSKMPLSNDKRHAIYAISKLGRTLIVHFKSLEADNIILDYVDTAELALLDDFDIVTEISQILFEIGICAIEENHDFIAVAALDKLTTLAENRSSLPDEFFADMLGLLSHFWVVGGSRKEYAEQKIKEVEELLPKGLTQSIKDARTHCLRTMHFETVDNLDQMKKDLGGRKKKK